LTTNTREKKNRERRNETENNIIEGERKSRTIRLLSLLVEMLLKMMLLLLFAARRRDIRVKESFNKEIWISFVIKSALLGRRSRARERFGFVHAMRIVSSRHRLYRLLSAIDFYPPKYYGLFCVK
jgi:hypothetical protein